MPMCVNRFLETKWDKPEKFEKGQTIVHRKLLYVI